MTYGPGERPVGHAQAVQAGEQAVSVGLLAFIAPANPAAQMDHGAKAGAPRFELFQSQGAVAKLVLVGEVAQPFQGGMPAAEQAVLRRLGHKVDVFGVDDFGQPVMDTQGTQLPAAPQFLVQQGLLLLDQAGFKQERANLASSADVGDPAGLAQKAGFVQIAQVCKDAAAQVDAFSSHMPRKPL